MLKPSLWALLLSPPALAACHNDSSVGRHSVAMEMCVANIPVYPPNQVPAVPYRMIAPVDSHWGITVTSRFEHMKAHACALGADAIIDSPDRYPESHTVTTTMQYDAYGRPIAMQQQATLPAWRSSPVAIKFVSLTAPPQVAMASPTVVINQAPQVAIVQAPPVIVTCPVSTFPCGGACCDTSAFTCDAASNRCVAH